MKIFLYTFLLLLPAVLKADDFFFEFAAQPDIAGARIEGEVLHLEVKIKRLPSPKAKGIEVEADEDGNYFVRVYLAEQPNKGWHPMVSLGGRILSDGIKVVTHAAEYASYFEIEFKDQDGANNAALGLATLLKVPEERLALQKDKPNGDVDAE